MADGLRAVAALPDPVGDVVRGYTVPNGLRIEQVRVPLGVVAIVYEARPNVTVDAAGLAVKSGNAALLRGSGSAYESNTVLVAHPRRGRGEGRPAPRQRPTRAGHRPLERRSPAARPRPGRRDHPARWGRVDLLRGRELDRAGDRDRGRQLPHLRRRLGRPGHGRADRASTPRCRGRACATRPRPCSSTATWPTRSCRGWCRALQAQGVTVHGDRTLDGIDGVVAAGDDWSQEHLSLDIRARVVDDVDDAIAHIRRWSSGHTEAIVTRDLPTSQRFIARVDSAAVMVNASTRFTDGAEFGFGAEIGISTQKLHARGPMGLPELTSTKWIVTGDGQIRRLAAARPDRAGRTRRSSGGADRGPSGGGAGGRARTRAAGSATAERSRTPHQPRPPR